MHLADLRLGEFGYQVGLRTYELTMWREKNMRRENQVLSALMYINSVVWKYFFGKQADSLERSTEHEDEYMIVDNEPQFIKYFSIPKEMSSFSPGAFMAGTVEAIMACCGCHARVTSHTMPTKDFPLRTVILIKVDPSVLEREAMLSKK
ncbi:protein particle complex subunit [Spiromyces aspiralis]|uniref:Protein particle complex subunit n=1 Tax=Spiromyces aspiralis TaxID=68401 RepID=A0ACC1HF67_9FUNG|nr:protein particle complex subunit [Spiromyces aspiralis]